MDRRENERLSNIHGHHAGLGTGWNQPAILCFSHDEEAQVADDKALAPDTFEDSRSRMHSPHPPPSLNVNRHNTLGTRHSIRWVRRELQCRDHQDHLQSWPQPEHSSDPTSSRHSSETSSSSSSASSHAPENPLASYPDPCYVDLTRESPAMSPSKRKPRSSGRPPHHRRGSSSQPAKRQKVQEEVRSIEEVDLREVESKSDLLKVLARQRAATVREQQEGADKPTKLGRVTCVVCMEELTNMTATHCGHLFCHTCLMEALIAGENQGGEPGKGQSKCPICRKKVKRPKDGSDTSNVIPLEIKLATKRRPLKGKARDYGSVV